MKDSREILGRLPRTYLHRGGDFLRRFVQITEELIDSSREGQADESPLHAALAALRSGSSTSDYPMEGTPLGLISWLDRRNLPIPIIWSGVELVEESKSRLRIQSSYLRSTALLWLSGTGPEVSRLEEPGVLPFEDLRKILPVRCAVQAALLEREPKYGRPLGGSILHGSLLFRL